MLFGQVCKRKIPFPSKNLPNNTMQGTPKAWFIFGLLYDSLSTLGIGSECAPDFWPLRRLVAALWPGGCSSVLSPALRFAPSSA